MSDFIVYGIPGSVYVRIALLGLEEKDLPYRLIPMRPGEHRAPEHLARQPFGRMPVVERGDFRLYEAQAILRYLDRLYPEPPFTPADPEAEARANQIAGIVDWYVMPDISSPITFQRLVAPKFGIPVDEERLAAALPRAEVCVAELSRLLGDQRFMAGDRLSIADLMLAPHLDYFRQVAEGREMLARHSNLAAWAGRMAARPSMVATEWDRLLERVAA